MKKLHRSDSKGDKNFVQLPLSREDRVAMIQDGLNSLACQLGLLAAQELLQAEIQDLCGPMHWRQPERSASRWGSQGGTVVLAGRKVPIQKPRARMKDGGEVLLQTYQKLQNPQAMSESALRHMVRGVSCREYEGCLEPLAEGFGMKRSSVSRGFVKASAKQMKTLTERRFEGQEFVRCSSMGCPMGVRCWWWLWGESREKRRGEGHFGAAPGGHGECPGLHRPFDGLEGSGVELRNPMLFVLDGSKALAAAVKRLCGSQVRIQRCQQHKIRNVLGYVAKKHHDDIRSRMAEAYACKDWREGEKRLNTLAAWLTRINKDAAASLREGLEETLTVAKLGLPALLAKSLVTTNPIESAFSVAGKVTGRVKRWRGGDMRQRWATAGLMRAEGAFKRLRGYREIPILQAALRRCTANDVDGETAAA